jgi:hypothetical protein
MVQLPKTAFAVISSRDVADIHTFLSVVPVHNALILSVRDNMYRMVANICAIMFVAPCGISYIEPPINGLHTTNMTLLTSRAQNNSTSVNNEDIYYCWS